MKLPLARRVIAITGTCALQLLAACGGGGTGAADAGSHGPDSPPSSGPTPLPQEFDIRGEVFSFDAGMIADSPINLWVQTPGVGYSYWWAYEPLHSDGLGLFEARVPASEITLHAFKEGYVQPCAVRAQVTRDVEVRIEMLPVAALNSANAPRPQSSIEPSITGQIFEIALNGRPKAIADAVVFAMDAMEVGRADTRSDLGGGYYLCNLPQGTYLDVRKDGFKPVLVGPVGGPDAAVVDIELKHELELGDPLAGGQP
jgi:hypothetical protein